MSINVEHLTARMRGYNEQETSAFASGYHHGWDRANWVETYGGEDKPEAAESDIHPTYVANGTDHMFTSGWVEGYDDFHNDTDES